MNPQHIFLALAAAEKLIELVVRLRAAAKQSAELTTEQEAELDARIAAVQSGAHWKVE